MGMELLTAEGLFAFGIELGVCQDAADGHLPMRPSHQHRQRGAVVPRRLPCMLGQNQLPLEVDHGQPLQPVFPTAPGLAEVLRPADKVTAHRALRQTRGVDTYRGRTSPPPRHVPHNLVHDAGYILHVQTSQKAIQRGVVGNGFQLTA
jgi:hypothetical protein